MGIKWLNMTPHDQQVGKGHVILSKSQFFLSKMSAGIFKTPVRKCVEMTQFYLKMTEMYIFALKRYGCKSS